MIRLPFATRVPGILSAGMFILLLTGRPAAAQVQVDLKFNRTLYIRYEPVIATVTIANLSGRPIELADDGRHRWFSFQIEAADGRLVPPKEADYQLSPLSLEPGERISRAINLTPLYPIAEYGVFRVRAAIYVAEMGRYFSSAPPLNIEITEGRTLWQQTVGVPDGARGGGQSRTITLLAHRLPQNTQLYLRVEDQENGVVFCTHQLGRFVSFGLPQIELDSTNQIHVLQNTSPRMFLYTHVGLGGEVIDRRFIEAIKQKPTLRKDGSGAMQIIGGIEYDPAAAAAAAEGQEDVPARPPSVGDRPVPMPPTPE